MPETRVVNKLQDFYDVDISRAGRWGNPFRIGPDGTREEVIDKYREWVVTRPKLMAQLSMLKGKRLGCYCHPLQCHGSVLIELVENLDA